MCGQWMMYPDDRRTHVDGFRHRLHEVMLHIYDSIMMFLFARPFFVVMDLEMGLKTL